MQKVYRAANLQEAYLVLHRLEQAGIEARVFNEHAHGGLGELPFTHVYPEIWVIEPADVERARRIVEDYQRTDPPAGVRVCRFCNEENPGGFEICWRCGASIESESL